MTSNGRQPVAPSPQNNQNSNDISKLHAQPSFTTGVKESVSPFPSNTNVIPPNTNNQIPHIIPDKNQINLPSSNNVQPYSTHLPDLKQTASVPTSTTHPIRQNQALIGRNVKVDSTVAQPPDAQNMS